MSELTDLLLQATDPVSALMLIVITAYIRQIHNELSQEIRRVRERTERLEGQHIPDALGHDDD